MVRVVVGGDELDGFGAGDFTDHYVKLQLPPAGADYAAPFDREAIKARLPREQWPRMRTYTVRAWDAERMLLTLDFVVHGDDGVAGPWAAAAAPGDVLQLIGPGGAYTPDPDADWHLMVGDERAARDRRLARAGARRRAGPRPARVDDDADRAAADHAGDLRVTWLRGDGSDRAAGSTRARARVPRGPVTRSSTARRARSAPCAGTSSSTRRRRSRRSRSPATGSARAPTRNGAPTRRSGTASPSRTSAG